jgi:hypothetical protein
MRRLVTVMVLMGITMIMGVMVVVMLRHLPLTGFVDPEKDDDMRITIQPTYLPSVFGIEHYCRDILVPALFFMRVWHLVEAVIS